MCVFFLLHSVVDKLPTAATHYSALHHAAVSGDTTNIHNIEYAVAAGFKTKQVSCTH